MATVTKTAKKTLAIMKLILKPILIIIDPKNIAISYILFQIINQSLTDGWRHALIAMIQIFRLGIKDGISNIFENLGCFCVWGIYVLVSYF